MRSVRVGLCTCPPGAPAVTEDRLEAIRQRHGHRAGYVSPEPMCECDEPWYECDAAQVLAALAAVIEERDAARARAEKAVADLRLIRAQQREDHEDAERLAAALADLVRTVAAMPDAGLNMDDPRWEWWYTRAAPSAERARKALAHRSLR